MSYFSAAKLRRLRQLSGMSLSDVFERTGVSRSQISNIENGKVDPRLSTVTTLLTCYRASLSDLEAGQPREMTLDQLRVRSTEAAQRLHRLGLGASDPLKRLDRKDQLGIDTTSERQALSTRK